MGGVKFHGHKLNADSLGGYRLRWGLGSQTKIIEAKMRKRKRTRVMLIRTLILTVKYLILMMCNTILIVKVFMK